MILEVHEDKISSILFDLFFFPLTQLCLQQFFFSLKIILSNSTLGYCIGNPAIFLMCVPIKPITQYTAIILHMMFYKNLS